MSVWMSVYNLVIQGRGSRDIQAAHFVMDDNERRRQVHPSSRDISNKKLTNWWDRQNAVGINHQTSLAL